MSDLRRAARWAYAQYAVNALLPLLLLPYLTRTLSTAGFAELAYFQAIAVAVGMMVDYGLGQASLARLIRCQGDAVAEARVVAEVTAARLALLLPGAAAIAALSLAAPRSDATVLFAIFTLVHVACNGLSPFWVFQAKLDFRRPVLVEILTRVVAFAAVLLVVREADDGWKAHAALGLGVLANLAYLFLRLPVAALPLAAALPRVGATLGSGTAVFGTRTLHQVATQLPLVLMSWLASPALVAPYAVAERLVRGLVAAAMPLALAAAPVVSRRLEEGSMAWLALRRRLALLGLALAGLAAALALLAGPVARIFSGYPGQAELLGALAAWIPLGGLNAFLIHAIVVPNFERFRAAPWIVAYAFAVAGLTLATLGFLGAYAGVAALVGADLLLLVLAARGLRRALR